MAPGEPNRPGPSGYPGLADAPTRTTRGTQITQEDVDLLRKKGLSDQEILDVVLAVMARNFMSKTLDALGAEPDDALLALEPELREALVIGRPFPSHAHG